MLVPMSSLVEIATDSRRNSAGYRPYLALRNNEGYGFPNPCFRYPINRGKEYDSGQNRPPDMRHQWD